MSNPNLYRVQIDHPDGVTIFSAITPSAKVALDFVATYDSEGSVFSLFVGDLLFEGEAAYRYLKGEA